MKLMISTMLSLLIAMTLSAWSAAPASQKFQLSSDGQRVEFLAVGRPSLIKIRGTSTRELQAQLSVSNGTVSGTFQFKLETLDTGIGKRDEHMKDKYLEVSKHPMATLQIQPVALTPGSEKPFEGTLELHGVKKPVSGKVVFTESSTAKAYGADANFVIKLQDFAIDIPRFAGITVADEVQIQVSTKFEVVK
jgi:polyisoprenoid-binding protein YceI